MVDTQLELMDAWLVATNSSTTVYLPHSDVGPFAQLDDAPKPSIAVSIAPTITICFKFCSVMLFTIV